MRGRRGRRQGGITGIFSEDYRLDVLRWLSLGLEEFALEIIKNLPIIK